MLIRWGLPTSARNGPSSLPMVSRSLASSLKSPTGIQTGHEPDRSRPDESPAGRLPEYRRGSPCGAVAARLGFRRQCLPKVGDDVGGALDADGNAHDARINLHGALLFVGQFAMGCHHRMRERGGDVA